MPLPGRDEVISERFFHKFYGNFKRYKSGPVSKKYLIINGFNVVGGGFHTDLWCDKDYHLLTTNNAICKGSIYAKERLSECNCRKKGILNGL